MATHQMDRRNAVDFNERMGLIHFHEAFRRDFLFPFWAQRFAFRMWRRDLKRKIGRWIFARLESILEWRWRAPIYRGPVLWGNKNRYGTWMSENLIEDVTVEDENEDLGATG